MKWYKYNIRDLCDAEYTKWYSLMSEDKRYRVDRFRFADDKKRTVAGEMLARQAIAEWCSVDPESIIFAMGEYGKPYVVDLDVEFNISHSGELVVCVVDDNPVGIDIEQIRRIDLSIAKRIYTEEELRYLFGHTPTEEDFVYITDATVLNRFFELWTAKEAYGKCIGVGICVNTNTLLGGCLTIHSNGNYMVNIYQSHNKNVTCPQIVRTVQKAP